jgi:hypothetical protein
MPLGCRDDLVVDAEERVYRTLTAYERFDRRSDVTRRWAW